MDLTIGSFHLPEGRWQGLEELNFWDNAEQERSLLGWLDWQGGNLDLTYKAGWDADLEIKSGSSCQWRVVERTGARFTIELAAFASGGPLEKEEEVLVLPDGTEEAELEANRDEDFWKQNAGLYAVEMVRFGHVWVSVPINVRDVETYTGTGGAAAGPAAGTGVRAADGLLTLRMDFNGRFGIQ